MGPNLVASKEVYVCVEGRGWGFCQRREPVGGSAYLWLFLSLWFLKSGVYLRDAEVGTRFIVVLQTFDCTFFRKGEGVRGGGVGDVVTHFGLCLGWWDDCSGSLEVKEEGDLK